MTEHLVFALTASLGAMGEHAGHARRGSLLWPGRAAVLGLCAAALGIRRDGDFAALDALKLAVAVFDSGSPLRDYHTTQTIPGTKLHQTRAQALRAGKPATTITLRDYRQGVAFGVALWGGPLEALRAALERPRFTLYLGRKSCPLSAPLAPKLVEAEGPEAALRQVVLPPWLPKKVQAQLIAADEGIAPERVETRHDLPRDRRRWHFAPREVALRGVSFEVARAGEGAA